MPGEGKSSRAGPKAEPGTRASTLAAPDPTASCKGAIPLRTKILPGAARLPQPARRPTCKGATNLLSQIISLVSGCVTFLGGFLVVWGAVSLGLAIREQQGGSQIASAISTIAGGAIIIAAAVYFGMLDTSWLPA